MSDYKIMESQTKLTVSVATSSVRGLLYLGFDEEQFYALTPADAMALAHMLLEAAIAPAEAT